MDNKFIKILLVVLILFVMPIVSGYIIVKLFLTHNGKGLGIIFISLIILELIFAVLKFIKYNKSKK